MAIPSAAGPTNASNPYNVGALQDVAINNLRCTWVQPWGASPPRPPSVNAAAANASLLLAKDLQVGGMAAGSPTTHALCCSWWPAAVFCTGKASTVLADHPRLPKPEHHA